MIDWLVELIQEVWRTRQVPEEWKDTTLVPLHKKKECKNYRGISLLSIPGKCFNQSCWRECRWWLKPNCPRHNVDSGKAMAL